MNFVVVVFGTPWSAFILGFTMCAMALQHNLIEHNLETREDNIVEPEVHGVYVSSSSFPCYTNYSRTFYSCCLFFFFKYENMTSCINFGLDLVPYYHKCCNISSISHIVYATILIVFLVSFDAMYFGEVVCWWFIV
jgi:hypothetical protein